MVWCIYVIEALSLHVSQAKWCILGGLSSQDARTEAAGQKSQEGRESRFHDHQWQNTWGKRHTRHYIGLGFWFGDWWCSDACVKFVRTGAAQLESG